MCGTCGCGNTASERRRIDVERSLLAANEQAAARLRDELARRGVHAIGLLGAPGAGKTALLEATFPLLESDPQKEAVVEGDCATDLDSQRIRGCGAQVAQVSTGALCHLDAELVARALQGIDLERVSRLWIENVGNLVCPAPFPCGESRRALLISVPEGEDKPAKHPATIAAADLLVFSKSDLLPHVPFDSEQAVRAARAIKPELPILFLSTHSGEGMRQWLEWVRNGRIATCA